jgi:hypothetical protein
MRCSNQHGTHAGTLTQHVAAGVKEQGTNGQRRQQGNRTWVNSGVASSAARSIEKQTLRTNRRRSIQKLETAGLQPQIVV